MAFSFMKKEGGKEIDVDSRDGSYGSRSIMEAEIRDAVKRGRIPNSLRTSFISYDIRPLSQAVQA